MRHGYSYAGFPDAYKGQIAPEKTGIWRMNLETGERELIISFADIAKIPYENDIDPAAKHYFNHLLFNTDGARFIFLHRRMRDPKYGFRTRLFTADANGRDIRLIDETSNTSHFIWRDPNHILAQWERTRGQWHFYLVEDAVKGKIEIVGQGIMSKGQHASYLPGNEWIVNDTYPKGKTREQYVFLYHVPTNKEFPLGTFYSPPGYTGEWRVDTHPRISPDGRSIVIDSPHVGNGRQMYLIDISRIVGRPN